MRYRLLVDLWRDRVRSMLVQAVVLSLVAACAPGPSEVPVQPASMAVSPSTGSTLSAALSLPGRFAVVFQDGGLWVMRGDGSDRRKLTSPTDGVESSPSWAPDASRLAFRHSTGSSGPDSDMIRVIQADGSGLRDLIPGIFPAWSPDGTMIAFRGNAGIDLAVIKPDGSGLMSLGVRNAECPTWSPDGQRLLFCRNENASGRVSDDWEVWVMNRDGSDQRQLTHDPSRDYPIAWSKDGTKILFYSDRDGPGASFIMDADGSNVRHVTDATDLVSADVWLPDGRIVIGSRADPPEWFVLDASGHREKIPQLSGAFTPIGWVDSAH